MKLFLSVSIALLLLLPSFGLLTYGAKKFDMSLSSITSGDRLEVELGGNVFTAVIIGVDAPETGQPLFYESKAYLRSIIAGTNLKLMPYGHDKNGNAVCYIYSSSGKDLSLEMLKAGMALPYLLSDNGQRFLTTEKFIAYEAASARAKSRKLGLYGLSRMVSPFCYKNASGTKCRLDKTYQPN